MSEARVAIVTGAARGIGRAIAERFVADGLQVVIADLDGAAAERTAAELEVGSGRPGTALGIAADCSERVDVERVVAMTIERLGRLDVLAANAGIGHTAALLDTSDELWDRTMAINLRGVYLAIQVAGRAMRDGGRGGRIVATSSTNAFWVETDLAAYNTSKAGVVGLVRTAAMELAPYGITVNAIGPGLIRTDLTRHLTDDPDKARTYLRQIPMGRFGSPADVAAAVAFLVSDDAAWITGHLLVIDGGQTMGTPLP